MPRLFGSLLSSGNRQSSATPGTGAGQGGRTLLGASAGRSNGGIAGGSLWNNTKSATRTLRESDSTEGLHPEIPQTPRGGSAGDFEFKELEGVVTSPGYSVNIMAGWEPKGMNEVIGAGVGGGTGMKTVVVTQKVTFAGEDGGRSSGDREDGLRG
ncbi:hypothetical protein VTI74DRAFT_4868 [Chaetomium olivicolor]